MATPPILNEMCFGARFAKSFAGETTLAAMFTLSVATTTVNIAMPTTIRDGKRPTRSIGSQIVLPKITTDALVMTTPIAAKTVIVVGSATTCPMACSRCDLPNRVKSGMLSESVAQNPTIAVTLGTNTFQNAPGAAKLSTPLMIGPSPPPTS